MDLARFYEEWLRGPQRLDDMFLELAHSSSNHVRFTRNVWMKPGEASKAIVMLRNERNIMTSIARYPEPSPLNPVYQVVVFDFDSEVDPRLALESALAIARLLSESLDCTPLIVKTGFKGAHVHIPLKQRLGRLEFTLVAKALLKRIPERYSALVDRNLVENERALARVPYTFNIKGGERRLAVLLDHKGNIIRARDFSWNNIELLDVSKLNIAIVEVEIPKVIHLDSKLGSSASVRSRWGWVEAITGRGLPDGRKRFVLHVLNPYLANILGLDVETALAKVKEFIEASCRNYGNCSKIYESWIRSDLHRVKTKGVMPAKLENLKEKDPELYNIISSQIEGS